MAQPMRQPEWRGEPTREIVRDVAFQPRDQVRWGPILGGVVVTLATMAILGVGALATGMAATDEGATAGDNTDTIASIVGVVIALLAFFLGGYIAGRTAAVRGTGAGTLNGAMVWAAALVIGLLLTAFGAGAALGMFGEIGIGGLGADEGARETTTAGLWWAFIGMAMALAAAAAGGYLGAPKHDLGVGRTIPETR